MRCRQGMGRLLGAALAMSAASQVAAAEPGAVRQAIEATYGVEVLDVVRLRLGNRQLYAVRVLTPGGRHNDSWQVNELLVDARDGRMVPAFQHGTSGYGFDGPGVDGAQPSADETLIRVPLPSFSRTVPVVVRSVRAAPVRRHAPAPAKGGSSR